MGRLLELIYLLAYLLALPWLVYRLVRAGGWEALADRISPGSDGPLPQCIWLHGSSVGEVSLLKPLVETLERSYPEIRIVISAYTATGIEAARSAYPGRHVLAFPFDFRWIVRRYLRKLNPRLVIIVESELWPNFIATMHASGIPIAVVNGKMSSRSFRIHSRTRLVARALRSFELVAVQTEEYAARMRALGVPDDRIFVTGNMKYDLAPPDPGGELREGVRNELSFGPEDVVIIGASLHSPEDEIVLSAHEKLVATHPEATLMLVPRYPECAAQLVAKLNAEGRLAVAKTDVDAGRRAAPGRSGVLVVDTLGELVSLYAAADVAFVGGSLFFRGSNKGGHNLMEPAVYGIPVLFGPYNVSFRETAAELRSNGGGIEVSDPGSLLEALEQLLSDPERRGVMGRCARDVIMAGRGATQRTFRLLRDLLDEEPADLQQSGIKRKMQARSF